MAVPSFLAQVKNSEYDFGWGAVVNFKRLETKENNPLTSEPTFVAEVLIHLSQDGCNSKVILPFIPECASFPFIN